MSASNQHSDLIEQVRIYLTWVPPDHAREATRAIDRLEEQLEAQERELVAARIDLARAQDMCARPAGVCFPASEPRYSRFGSSLYDHGEQNQEGELRS